MHITTTHTHRKVRPTRIKHFGPNSPQQVHLRSVLSKYDDMALTALENEISAFGSEGVLSSTLENLIGELSAVATHQGA